MGRRPKILFNAMHTTTGGGVTYLQGVLPGLVRDARFVWELLVTPAVRAKLQVPDGVMVREVEEMGFWRGHVHEQVKLPLLCRAWGVDAVLCNANYVPLLAPRPVPIIHTTTRASGQTTGWRMEVYWWVLRTLTRLSVMRAGVAFSLSAHVVGEYVTAGWLRKKVRLAPPAVGKVAVSEQRDGNLVVAVGDFYPQKDYSMLVRAFARVLQERPKTRLVIVGRAVNEAERDKVVALIRELGLAKAVTLTGWLPHAEMMRVLGTAGVFVSTSLSETVQIPLLEAMAAGVPVVAGKAPHSEEFVGDAGVLVAVEKGGDIAAAFAVAMYGALENPAVAENLKKRGLARAREFSWEKSAGVIAEGMARMFWRN